MRGQDSPCALITVRFNDRSLNIGDPATNRMSLSARNPRLAWVIVPVCALGLLAWCDQARVRRVEYVSGLEGRARTVDVPDAGSPTGYADGQRELIVPEGTEASFHWIEETQQMFARGEARVRHVDFENAPAGHDVYSASPYRWWLGFVAWLDHMASGRPIGLSVERAALYADPLLHVLLVACAGAFVAWRFGCTAAALLCVGLVTLFPFASDFLPGMPDQRGLAEALGLGSVLVLLAGMGKPARRRARLWFALAGVVGGLGMWISVPTQVPITVGIVLGGLGASWLGRRRPQEAESLPAAMSWRTWAFSGGLTVLGAYFAEFFPGYLGSWRLESVHPAYGLAWIGAGELLARATSWFSGERPSWKARDTIMTVLAAAGVAIVPAIMWKTGNMGFLARQSTWARLTGLPGGAVAAGSGAWLVRDGLGLAAWATLLPIVAAALALWLVFRRSTGPRARASLAVASGPVLVAFGFAFGRLGWWSVFDCMFLALIVAALSGEGALAGSPIRWILIAVTLAFSAAGATQLVPRGVIGPTLRLTPGETEGIVDRALAHWLARRAGVEGTVIYAPPAETTGLCFYGSLRGIGTFAPDNTDGFRAALNIAAAPTMEEAQRDLQARGVEYVLIPSWDPFFDEFAKRYLDKRFAGRPNFFVGELRRFDLPTWLWPVPYQMPVAGGFAGQSVLVLQVVDEQGPAAAASRLAEYLVETGNLDAASAAGEKLRRFPGDVGALAALAQVEGARGESAANARTVESLLERVSNNGDRFLPWDRRVSLAIVLAQAGQNAMSRSQAARCFGEVSEARLRELSTGSLFDLLVLGHSFGLAIADPRLQGLSLELLPNDLRSRL
jgi:hypothetical protein